MATEAHAGAAASAPAARTAGAGAPEEEQRRAQSFFQDHSVATTMTMHMAIDSSLSFEDALLGRLRSIQSAGAACGAGGRRGAAERPQKIH